MKQEKSKNKQVKPEEIPPNNIPKLVMVIWEDALELSDGGPWMDNKPKPYKPHIFWHVGFLVSEYPEGIHLTEAWSQDLIAKGTQIPRGMIRSITELKY